MEENPELLQFDPRYIFNVMISIWTIWRRVRESNTCLRICNPLHNHSATEPKIQTNIIKFYFQCNFKVKKINLLVLM